MTISAIRFKNLDKSTDVAISDFIGTKSNDIFNSPNMDTRDLTEDMKSFFENSLQVAKVNPPSAIDTLSRVGKDALGTIKDIGTLSGKDIDSLIGTLLGNNPKAKQLFSKLGPKCQSKGLGSGGFGKPYDTSINCGGGKRKGAKNGCTSSAYADVLNSATGGAYNVVATDLNAALSNLISMSKFGYDMNMCGVFAALGLNGDKNMLSRASGSLLGYLGSSGNTLGVFDLAGASAGLHTLIENPSGITGVFKNFTVPGEIKASGLSGLSDRLTGSMELFSDTWNASGYDGMLSTNFSDGYNAGVAGVFQAKQFDTSFSANSLDVIPSDDHAYMSTAYSMSENSIADSLLA